MKNYSIVRIGHEYIVRADEESILKVNSRRRAARLVSEASELLDMQSEQAGTETSVQSDEGVSADRDPSDAP
jgi:hypothetical protein